MLTIAKKRSTKKETNTVKEEKMQQEKVQFEDTDDDLVFEMTPEAVEKLEKKLQTKTSIYKFPNGDTIFLLLPPKKSYKIPDNIPFVITSVHYLGDIEKHLGMPFPEELSKMQTCALIHGEKKCAWCEWMRDLKASTSNAHNQLGGKIYPNPQGYANIVDITSRDPERWEVVLARFPKTVAEPLLSQIKFGAALHKPSALLPIHVKRTEVSGKIKYTPPAVLVGKAPIPFNNSWGELMQNPMSKVHAPMPYTEAKQWIMDLQNGNMDYSADYTNY